MRIIILYPVLGYLTQRMQKEKPLMSGIKRKQLRQEKILMEVEKSQETGTLYYL
jgi:hypothetical protein